LTNRCREDPICHWGCVGGRLWVRYAVSGWNSGNKFAKGGSDMREAPNQSNQLLADIRLGKHDGCEVWGVADNTVWFLVWNKDLSSAKHLFNLVLELRVECRKHGLSAYLRRGMIVTGMDGIGLGEIMT
jgi:hypothetical protein